MSEEDVRKSVAAAITEASMADTTESPPELDLQLAGEPHNDLGNANRLMARHGRNLLFVTNPGAPMGWLAWDGTHWSLDAAQDRVRQSVTDTALSIHNEVIALRNRGPDAGEDRAVFDKRLTTLSKFAVLSGNASRLDAMLRVAEPQCLRRRSELDSHPHLLNVENGTLELGVGEGLVSLRAPRRDDLLTHVAPVRYDPEADCPRFRGFLETILPDREVQLFLQRWFGYCLTGYTDEQCLVMLWGTGKNGKSTLLNVIRGVLSSYAITSPVQALLEETGRRGGDATPDLARLLGARVMLAAEPERRARLSASIIKSLTGGEPIAARKLFGEFFEFVPVVKIMLVFNTRPTIPADDDGMWRRLLLVAFGQKIDRPVARFEQILLEERSGILNWMLDGYRLWRERGLELPDAVRATTQAYREESDHVGQFLTTCTIPASMTSTVPRGRLWDEYQKWCRLCAIGPLSANAFGRALTAHGIQRAKSSTTIYCGLTIVLGWETTLDVDTDGAKSGVENAKPKSDA